MAPDRPDASLPPAPDVPPVAGHEVTLVEHHRFTQPVCSCGWVGAGRRARRLARDEARDHALLYADLPAAPGPLPQPREQSADDGVTTG